MNAERLTQKSAEAIRSAQQIAQEYGNPQIEQVHLLWALLQDSEGLIPQLLSGMGVTVPSLEAAVKNLLERQPRVSSSGHEAGKIYISAETEKALNRAEKIAGEMKDEYTSVEHLFLGLLETAGRELGSIFSEYRITKERALQALTSVRGNQRVTSDNPEETYGALKKYGSDLVERARQNKLDPVIGTMACPVCGTALQPDDVWLKKGSSGWYTLSQCPVCKGRGGEAGRGVFQKYRMSRRDGLHWTFARCVQMPDDASLVRWKKQKAQYLERQRLKAERQAAEAEAARHIF